MQFWAYLRVTEKKLDLPFPIFWFFKEEVAVPGILESMKSHNGNILGCYKYFMKALIQLLLNHTEVIPTIQHQKIPSSISFPWGTPTIYISENLWKSSLSELLPESSPTALFLEFWWALMSPPTFQIYPVTHVIFVCLFK